MEGSSAMTSDSYGSYSSDGSSDLLFKPTPEHVALMDAMSLPISNVAQIASGLANKSESIKIDDKIKVKPWVSALEVPGKDRKRKIVPIFGVKVEF